MDILDSVFAGSGDTRVSGVHRPGHASLEGQGPPHRSRGRGEAGGLGSWQPAVTGALGLAVPYGPSPKSCWEPLLILLLGCLPFRID